MPLVKYRINEGNINEIFVDCNVTVSRFIELVNRRSFEKVTKGIFRGKILSNDDLVRNYITRPDYILILLTNDYIESDDVMDLEQDIKENEKKNEIKYSISSSFLFRTNDEQQRKDLKYVFTIFTTATPDSMLHGNKIEFSLNYSYQKVYEEIENLVSDLPHADKNFDFDLHLFLPGGVHFKTGTLLEFYSNPEDIAFDYIYVIVTKKTENHYSIDDIIEEPCSCSNAQRSEILSPLCQSTAAGLSQIATFLGYVYYGGLKSEQILLSLAKITRFAPLVVNLFRLIRNRPLNTLNILAITAPLFTLFRSILPDEVKNENVFEYTLNFLSAFDVINNSEYLKFIELDTNDEYDCESNGRFADYCKTTNQQQHVIVWTADTINPDFQAFYMKPSFDTIQNILETITTYKPVSPLSLHYIFYPTFISSNNDKNVMLFIKEVPNDDNLVSIIDPNEGHKKEINIEELAKQVNCDKIEDILTLINPNQVDQIIFICFDESKSMKWKLEGGNAHHNEQTRDVLATEFLKALVKQSYALRVSSLYGLISFGSEVKILQPLTAMNSQFIQSLTKIDPHGKTHLYDAINVAKQQICNLIKKEDGKLRFPNSRFRIIVISDGADNKSETRPENLINDLIQNEIVVDTVLVSLVDRNADCCTISRLTGGLCFMTKDYENGIQIFEQEAFLNIKCRRMISLPYEKVTSEIFIEEKKKFDNHYDSYAPNQMIMNANAKVSLATPMYMSYISTTKRIKSYRTLRAFAELNIIAKNPNDSFIVFSLFATPEEWRIFIKGPKETPFSDKWLSIYMTIPQNYPNEPPRFRFVTVPFHPNVSSEGTIVFSLNDKDYTSSIGVDRIIIGIIDLLKTPDENYAINRNAMELFKNDKVEFERKQNEGETGCIDYCQYLQDIKIYSEIPKNAVVPDENRIKSNIISLTKDIIDKAFSERGKVIARCLLNINNYEILKKLGQGSFGIIYLVREKTTNNEFAAKIPICTYETNKIIDYINEVNVMSTLNHGAIVKMYGYCLNDFDRQDNHVIIMEYVSNGDLQQILDSERKGLSTKRWDETQKLIILYGIASGMAYSSSHGILHSDLKPENILMTDNLYPKISDFDSAKLEVDDYNQSFNLSGREMGSPLYTAPEILKEEKNRSEYTEKSDVYSYSMILYQVVTGTVPFKDKPIPEIYDMVKKGKRPKIPSYVNPLYAELITKCWDKSPDQRPTFIEIADFLKSDEFLSKNNDIDNDRFQDYVEYINNYKDIYTKSKFIRPMTQAENYKIDDEVMKNPGNIPILNLSEYDKGNILGHGRYSQVIRIENKTTKKVFAAKISHLRVSKEVSQNILSEINIMKNLKHPSILNFIGYSPVNFDKNPNPTIITEFASNGSLQTIIDNNSSINGWNDTKRLITIFGIVAGMAYLHDQSILHNDLKPSNILLDDNLYPKIADFGLSQKKANVKEGSNYNTTHIKGTPSYIAPEIIEKQNYSEASDMYSFGILLYEIVCLKNAFYGMKSAQIYYDVSKNRRPSLFFSKAGVFKSLIQRCWEQDPNKRPTFKELITELQDKKYITKDVNQDEYMLYVKNIMNQKA